MIATCAEMVLFFPNTLCIFLNDDRTVSIQPSTGLRSVAADCRLNAKRSPNERQSVGDHTSNGKNTIAVVTEVAIKISRREVRATVTSSEELGLYLVNITDCVDEVRKRDEMRGLSSMLSIFRYKLKYI